MTWTEQQEPGTKDEERDNRDGGEKQVCEGLQAGDGCWRRMLGAVIHEEGFIAHPSG